MTAQYYDGFRAVTAGAHSLQSPGIHELSARIRQLIVLLDECLIGTAGSPDDLRALAWITKSLEDIEATITELADSEQVTDGGTLPRVSGCRQAVRRTA